jgi:ferredoxin--NADP+ reductase
MACGCGRSPDGCRGWHALSEEEYQVEYKKYLEEEQGQLTVTEVEHYTDSLFRFRLTKPANFKFRAGEFTMVSVEDAPKRAYSITSGPNDDFIEFYSIKVPGGPLTSKLKNIKVGDTVSVGNKPTGTLLVDNLTEGNDLWLLATGTGIAPFISLLRDPATRSKYKRIHVVWSVRTQAELEAYDDIIGSDVNVDYVPVVTQDADWPGETNRITTLIKNGAIMTGATPDNDKVMLCGNMDFNLDIKEMLESNGWSEGNKKSQGSFVLEKAFVG